MGAHPMTGPEHYAAAEAALAKAETTESMPEFDRQTRIATVHTRLAAVAASVPIMADYRHGGTNEDAAIRSSIRAWISTLSGPANGR
jgi:hypothetical protein